MTKRLLLVFAIAAFWAVPLLGQSSGAPDVVGLLRGDGIVLPFYQLVDSGWIATRGPGPRGWSGVREYHLRGPDGLASTAQAGAVVLLWDAYDEWGHLTDLRGIGASAERIGYVVSVPGGDAPFARAVEVPSPTLLRPLFDSLAPIPDTVDSTIDVVAWQASLDEDLGAVFFSATRQARGIPDGPCLGVTGVVSGSGILSAVETSGYDWCDGTSRTPWALLRREGRAFILVSTRSPDDLGTELWSRDAETGTWFIALQVNNSGHSMMGVPGR